jgi:hypothetical protein
VFIWFRMTGRWLVVRLVASTLLLPGVALAAALPAMAALGTAVVTGVVLLVIEWRTRAFAIGAAEASIADAAGTGSPVKG